MAIAKKELDDALADVTALGGFEVLVGQVADSVEGDLQRVLDKFNERSSKNPITFIHDVGAGGISNAIPELAKDTNLGVEINLENIDLSRIGVIWGSGVGGIETFQNELINFSENDKNPKFNPFFIVLSDAIRQLLWKFQTILV